MRYYIYISFLAVLSVLCFNNAMGQGISPFGANRAQDTSKTKGQIVATAYANPNPAMFVRFDNKGHMIMAVPAGSGGGSVDSVTISNDSLFYWGGGVSFFVGIVNSGGSVDTTGLSDRIAYNLTRIYGLSDTGSNLYDTAQVHEIRITDLENEVANIPIIDSTRYIAWPDTTTIIASQDYVNNAIADIPPDTIPSLQAVTLEDSTTTTQISARRFITGIPDTATPDSMFFWGDSIMGGYALSDSNDAADEIITKALGMGHTNFAVAGTTLENGAPIGNMLDDYMGTIPTWHPGLYACMAYGYNDVYYNYPAYTPANFKAAYQRVLDTFFARGWPTSRIILNTPFYAAPTAYLPVGGNAAATQARHLAFVDTTISVANENGLVVADQYRYMASKSNPRLYIRPDSIHINETGNLVIAELILSVMGEIRGVIDSGESIVNSGVITSEKYKFGTFDTATQRFQTAVINERGVLAVKNNAYIEDTPPTAEAQGVSMNIGGPARANNFTAIGIGPISYTVANNTSVRGGASTGGTIYLDASGDITGTVQVRATSTNTFNSSGFTTTANILGVIVRASTAFQGNAASNGTLYVDASQNTTGTVNIRAGSTTTFNSSGITATAITQTGAHTINNNWQVGTDGKIKEYGNATPANGQLLVGDGTDMELATLTAGSGISVTNGAGSITLAVTGKVDSVTKSNDSFFYYKGAVRTFIGLDNSGSGSGIDSVRISNDSLYQCSSGTCTFVGLVNAAGGGGLDWSDTTGSGGLTTQYRLDTAYAGLENLTWTLNSDILDSIAAHSAMMAIIQDSITSYDIRILANVSAIAGKQDALGFTAENVANKATTFGVINNTLYPSVEAVDDYVTAAVAALSSVYQPLDGDLTAIAGLSPTNDDILQRKAGSWINRTMAQLKTDLGLVKADVGLSNVDNTADASKNVATAATLTTARNIDNTSFNGSAPIVLPRVWQGKIAGETDTLTTGVKLTFRMPYACTITGVKAAVNTASSSGNITIDIHENGTTIMSTTKITINATETSSLAVGTTQPVLTDTSIAADALIEVEVDVAGTNAISGEVTIYYTLQ